MPEELHISSLIVHSAPARAERTEAAISSMPGACVHATADNGKLVVTLEASTAAGMTVQVDAIQHLDGVLSAALVYQCADSLDVMNEVIPA